MHLVKPTLSGSFLLSSLVLDGLWVSVIQLGFAMMCGFKNNLLLNLGGAPCDVDADAV